MNPISLFLLAYLGLLVILWVRSLPTKKRGKAVLLIILVVVSLFVLLMAFTGRLHWIAAVAAALLPFAQKLFPLLIRLLPFIGQAYKSRQQTSQSSGNRSEVKTRIIQMQLDHDSGVMYGTIIEGDFTGKALGDLTETQFIELLKYCRETDQDSARLLEAYLDKRFGDSWRQDDSADNVYEPGPGSTLSIQEAYEILGLKLGATREEIIEAHRRLMQKNHPDRGGSDYLAAKINQAKDLLLKQL
ncbi:MAG: DnaJ domain-containing protein [Neptuniibacter sp.]